MHRTNTAPSPLNLITTWFIYILRFCKQKRKTRQELFFYCVIIQLFLCVLQCAVRRDPVWLRWWACTETECLPEPRWQLSGCPKLRRHKCSLKVGKVMIQLFTRSTPIYKFAAVCDSPSHLIHPYVGVGRIAIYKIHFSERYTWQFLHLCTKLQSM